jgi:digeranylgeranylglycerophospholipid reductase
MRDIIVAGAGPAGLIAGAEAAKAGAGVLIMEEDSVVGKPDHCTGLISKTGLEKLIAPSPSFVLNEIKGARIFSPSGKGHEVITDETKAYVIDRTKFDLELARVAEKCGAEVVTGEAFPKEEKSKVIINAEGVKGKTSRLLGFDLPKSIQAVQMDVEVDDFEKDMVELYIGRHAPGFFAWRVPRGDHVRVGLACYRGVPLELLRNMIESDRNFARVKGGKSLGILPGKVVIGGPLRKTVLGNAMAIGDAGGFVKPTTGGGVALGGAIAQIAGRVAAQHIIDGRPLKRFEKEWKGSYGREFRVMKLAARIFSNMREEELERGIASAQGTGILGAISEYDLDLQGKAVNKILESKLLRFAVMPFLRSLF